MTSSHQPRNRTKNAGGSQYTVCATRSATGLRPRTFSAPNQIKVTARATRSKRVPWAVMKAIMMWSSRSHCVSSCFIMAIRPPFLQRCQAPVTPGRTRSAARSPAPDGSHHARPRRTHDPPGSLARAGGDAARCAPVPCLRRARGGRPMPLEPGLLSYHFGPPQNQPNGVEAITSTPTGVNQDIANKPNGSDYSKYSTLSSLSVPCAHLPFESQTRGEKQMPLFLDVHNHVPEAKAKDDADAHMKDLKVQGKDGVNYLKYWLDESKGKIFCLADAPNNEAAGE